MIGGLAPAAFGFVFYITPRSSSVYRVRETGVPSLYFVYEHFPLSKGLEIVNFLPSTLDTLTPYDFDLRQPYVRKTNKLFLCRLTKALNGWDKRVWGSKRGNAAYTLQ